MSENVLGIALVGCGGMASRYRRRYTQIPDARLVLVVDALEETARNAAKALGVARWSTDFESALAPDIHIVDISTPNHMHAAQAIAALKAGKDVILQKPIAPNIEEAEAIVATARQLGRKAGMYMWMFEGPVYHDIKKMIDSGHLGSISNVYCRGAHRGGLSLPPDTWRNSAEKTGGGAFIQLTVHFINMAQWLVGSRIARVSAFSKNMMCPTVGGDDDTAAACEFENGILGTLEASYFSGPNILGIYGTKGFVTVTNDTRVDIQLDDPFKGDSFNYTQSGKIQTFDTEWAAAMEEAERIHGIINPRDQHIAFVKAVQEGRPEPIPAEIGLYDLKIVKAVYRSAEEKRVVEVE